MSEELSSQDSQIERLLSKAAANENILLVSLEAATAEIERLKAEYLKLDEKLEQALRKNQDQATLLTELADALVKDDQNYIWYNQGDELIQRARKAATK